MNGCVGTLANNYTNATPAAQPQVALLNGGRYVAVVSGTLPVSVVIQLMDRSGGWQTVQLITATGIQTVLYLPGGIYRVNLSGGSAANLCIDLYQV